MLSHFLKRKISKFTQYADYDDNGEEETTAAPLNITTTMVFELIFLLVSMLIVTAFFGKYLWNNAARPLIPALAECKSSWTIVGLHVLILILIGM